MSYHDHRGHCSGLSDNKINPTTRNIQVFNIEVRKLLSPTTIEDMVKHVLLEFRQVSENPHSEKDLFYKNLFKAGLVLRDDAGHVVKNVPDVFPTKKMISIIEEAERRAFGTTVSIASGWV